MTGHAVQRRFPRERVAKFFGKLGSDNRQEVEKARNAIDAVLHEFSKTWPDLIELLVLNEKGRATALRADLVRDIVALGSRDPDNRVNARRKLADLLEQHRLNWSDLVNALCGTSHEAWACDPSAADPERVNPLDLVHYLLKEYVALREPHEYVAVALWALHTHVFKQFMVTPRLALRSVLQPNGKLRAVFNSGHRNGGTTALMERGTMRSFSTFAPLALALPDVMSGLPRTLNSRCLTITMQRYDGQHELRRLDANRPDLALDAAYAQILLWRRELQQLDPDPEMPEMRNRHADNWRPLISIADALGRGVQAREAMVKFTHDFQDTDVRILLLGDIREVFNTHAVDRLPSKTLLGALYALDDADWNEFRGVRGERQPHKLTDSELAAMLREFRIIPHNIWPLNRTAESKSARGYRRAQFEEVWRVYCTDDGTA